MGGDKAAFDAKYGADLWKEDIEQYDKVCKVEPFQRGLKTLGTDCMINGRTRWQGFERAWIDLFENALVGGGKPAVLTVYAPWCQFCQGMEADYEKLAEELSIPVAKFRGDEERDFVSANLNTESFPTVNVITSDGKVVKYDSEERSVEALKAFVEANV